MAKVSPNVAPSLMLIAISMAMLIQTGMGQQLIPFQRIPDLLTPTPDLTNCWSSLTTIPTCLNEIYASFLGGQIGKLGPACCAAINQISDSCWPKMFPLSPFFPPILKNFCALPPPLAIEASKVSLPKPNITEITECWSSITSIELCALEIYKSLTTGQAGIGPTCCKAVIEISDRCWRKMFPFNPFFPPSLKNTCAKVIEAPSPTAVSTSGNIMAYFFFPPVSDSCGNRMDCA